MGTEAREAAQDRPIQELKEHLAAMATLAEGMVADGARAFLQNDAALSDAVLARDPELDRRDVEMESESIRLIAVLQPEGHDLRMLGAALKIANCVDRVGRLGYDLAGLEGPRPEPSDREIFALLARMDASAREMVRESIAAFGENDAARAKRVFAMDDAVDGIHQEVQRRAIVQLRAGGASADRLALALLAARHLERVGDNACKIAEKVVYAVTGERRPEYFPKRVRRAVAPP